MITKTPTLKRKPPVAVASEAAESAESTNMVRAKKSKHAEPKIRAPTLEEINELKETRNLFHSNLLRLQVKEMLSELQIKQKHLNFISGWFEQFRVFVAELKDNEPSAKLLWLQKSPLQVPLALYQLRINELELKQIQFQFIKPNSEPLLMGAAASSTLLAAPNGSLMVDIAVNMPSSCFQKDSYLNLDYDQRRALYLTYVANELLKSKQMQLNVDQLLFSYHSNNPLKPVLIIRPTAVDASTNSSAKKVSFRLFMAGEEQTFKLARFVPWNSNIRASIFYGHVEENDGESANYATPHYNAHVLYDLTMRRNQLALAELFQAEKRKNLQEALLLLKVWLQQRQLNMAYSGMNGHMLAMFILYLWQQRKLNANMSSYQVARTVWNQLGRSTVC